jgi:hypothetical protein
MGVVEAAYRLAIFFDELSRVKLSVDHNCVRCAWELKEAFLDYWCFRAMRSRLEPMKKVARMLALTKNSY